MVAYPISGVADSVIDMEIALQQLITSINPIQASDLLLVKSLTAKKCLIELNEDQCFPKA